MSVLFFSLPFFFSRVTNVLLRLIFQLAGTKAGFASLLANGGVEILLPSLQTQLHKPSTVRAVTALIWQQHRQSFGHLIPKVDPLYKFHEAGLKVYFAKDGRVVTESDWMKEKELQRAQKMSQQLTTTTAAAVAVLTNEDQPTLTPRQAEEEASNHQHVGATAQSADIQNEDEADNAAIDIAADNQAVTPPNEKTEGASTELAQQASTPLPQSTPLPSDPSATLSSHPSSADSHQFASAVPSSSIVSSSLPADSDDDGDTVVDVDHDDDDDNKKASNGSDNESDGGDGSGGGVDSDADEDSDDDEEDETAFKKSSISSSSLESKKSDPPAIVSALPTHPLTPVEIEKVKHLLEQAMIASALTGVSPAEATQAVTIDMDQSASDQPPSSPTLPSFLSTVSSTSSSCKLGLAPDDSDYAWSFSPELWDPEDPATPIRHQRYLDEVRSPLHATPKSVTPFVQVPPSPWYESGNGLKPGIIPPSRSEPLAETNPNVIIEKMMQSAARFTTTTPFAGRVVYDKDAGGSLAHTLPLWSPGEPSPSSATGANSLSPSSGTDVPSPLAVFTTAQQSPSTSTRSSTRPSGVPAGSPSRTPPFTSFRVPVASNNSNSSLASSSSTSSKTAFGGGSMRSPGATRLSLDGTKKPLTTATSGSRASSAVKSSKAKASSISASTASSSLQSNVPSSPLPSTSSSIKRRATAPARVSKTLASAGLSATSSGPVPSPSPPPSSVLKAPILPKSIRSLSSSSPSSSPPPAASPPTLIFESRFESGNLHRVVQISETQYDLVLSTDVNSRGHTQWFYFQIRGAVPGVKYQFNMLNLEKNHSTFNTGMKPVMFSQRMHERDGISWHRAMNVEDVAYFRNLHYRPYEDAASRLKVGTQQQQEDADDGDGEGAGEDEEDADEETATLPNNETTTSDTPPSANADVTPSSSNNSTSTNTPALECDDSATSRPSRKKKRVVVIKKRPTLRGVGTPMSDSKAASRAQSPEHATQPPTSSNVVHSPPPPQRSLRSQASTSTAASPDSLDTAAFPSASSSTLARTPTTSRVRPFTAAVTSVTGAMENVSLTDSSSSTAASRTHRPLSSPIGTSTVSFASADGDSSSNPSSSVSSSTTGHSQLLEFDMTATTTAKKKVAKKKSTLKSKSSSSRSSTKSGESAKDASTGTTKKKKVLKKAKKGAETFYTLSFSMKFPYADDTIFLAYHFPFTYSFQRECLDALYQSSHLTNNCLRRQKLALTRGGNLCELLTITDFPRRQSDVEQVKRRKLVVLSARIHPGESNASWIMKGLLEFLVGPSETASWLRQNIVFKIVPMLNCDGVIEGNYRTSLTGVDLNRHWDEPTQIVHPTIYHTRKLLLSLSVNRSLLLFCDFHGHSAMKNMCLYGCDMRSGGDGSLAPAPLVDTLQFSHVREALTVMAPASLTNPTAALAGNAIISSASSSLSSRGRSSVDSLSSEGMFAAAMARRSLTSSSTSDMPLSPSPPPLPPSSPIPNPLASIPSSLMPSARAVLASPLLLELRGAHVFPELLARRHDVGNRYFNQSSCAYHIRKSKAGTARVVFWRSLRCWDIFTFEASFAGSTLGDMKGQHFHTSNYEDMGAKFVETIRDFVKVRKEKYISTQQMMWNENAKANTIMPTSASSTATGY